MTLGSVTRAASTVEGVRPGRLPGGPSMVAASVLLIGYLVGFSFSVASAVIVLEQGAGARETSIPDRPADALAGYVFALLLGLAAAMFCLRACRRRFGLTDEALGLRATAVTRARGPVAALAYLALLTVAVSVTAAALTALRVGPSGVDGAVPAGPGAMPVELFHSVIAGVIEEPVLLAVPVALGRRCRWPWWVTLSLMIVMRIAFHIYEGWDCLFVFPWIAGAFVLYRWCSLLWPFVVAHGAYDVLQVLRTYGGHATATIAHSLLVTSVLALAAIGALGCRRAGLFNRSRPQPGIAAIIKAATMRNGPSGM